MNLCLHEFEVKGILDGTITELWRPCKGTALDWLNDGFTPKFVADLENSLSPFGSVGTRITGKETWFSDWDNINHFRWVHYKADMKARQEHLGQVLGYFNSGCNYWKRPVVMPSWASRITLINLGVICKPVREITEEEARAAGFNGIEPDPQISYPGLLPSEDFHDCWLDKYAKKYPFELAYTWKLKFEAEVKR